MGYTGGATYIHFFQTTLVTLRVRSYRDLPPPKNCCVQSVRRFPPFIALWYLIIMSWPTNDFEDCFPITYPMLFLKQAPKSLIK